MRNGMRNGLRKGCCPVASSCEPQSGAQSGPPYAATWAGPAAAHRPAPRRVVIDPGGPILVEGPVEVVLADGRTVSSDRFLVALCACRRSGSYPWCDSSHRRRPPPDSVRQGPSQ
jgi:hypothetical protein